MKSISKFILASVALVGSASATTISIGGGTASATLVTSTGVTLTAANSTIQIGTYNGTTFTQFAPIGTDATPMVIGSGVFAGKVTGNFSDNTAAASAFNGQVIWFKVTVDLGGGVTGTSYFGAPAVGTTLPAIATTFPTNGFGASDSLSAETRNLTLLGAGSSAGSAAYNSGTNQLVIGVVPEPSAALLGAIGALGLLRRRR